MSAMLSPNMMIPATGGEMAGFLALPGSPPRTTVPIAVELWGMTRHMQEVAERLAGAGHAALVMDLFRGARPPAPQDPPECWAATFEEFDDVRATRDCRCALSWVLAGGVGRMPGPVAAWGFCMGGRFAHNLAAFDLRLAGAINFYGRINFPRMAAKPFLPIEVTPMIECPYLGVFAGADPLIPPADVAALRAGLAGNPHARIKEHPEARHAFFNDHRDTYHPQAASCAWASVTTFLDELA